MLHIPNIRPVKRGLRLHAVDQRGGVIPRPVDIGKRVAIHRLAIYHVMGFILPNTVVKTSEIANVDQVAA